MQEKTIINALLQIRREVLKRDPATLPHVDAVLTSRGIDVTGLSQRGTMPADTIRKKALKRFTLAALRQKPMLHVEIATLAADEFGLPYDTAYKRTGMGLARFKADGLVVREGRVWRLAQ